MKTPRIPPNENQRLQALRSLNILDTVPEERFDRVTRVARRMFDVPIALVCLVDEHRQWFKSAMGLSLRETSRDISFCGHAILDDLVMVVRDATLDSRFVDNPLVTHDPHIRFYAACPLRLPDGSNVGTLCLMDYLPREFGLDQLEALVDLASRVERELTSADLGEIDRLTGISNQDGFFSLAEKSLKLCERNKKSASLVVVDLNEFRLVNFAHGRGEGDRVLRGVARKICQTFRNSDVFGRLAGDEFAGLLTNRSYESAQELVAKFRASIETLIAEENLHFDLEFSEAIVTVQHEKDYDLGALLTRARRKMGVKKRTRVNEQPAREPTKRETLFKRYSRKLAFPDSKVG